MSAGSVLSSLSTLLLHPSSSSKLSVLSLLLAESLNSLNLYILELATLLDPSKLLINSLSLVKTNRLYKDLEL
jgi:hypothetical protein